MLQKKTNLEELHVAQKKKNPENRHTSNKMHIEPVVFEKDYIYLCSNISWKKEVMNLKDYVGRGEGSKGPGWMI